MKKKIKKTKRKKIRNKTLKATGKVTLNFKVKPEKAKEIKALARRFTKGNVTALVLGSLAYA